MNYGTSFYDEDEEQAPWQALLGHEAEEPRDLTPPAPEPALEMPRSFIQEDNDAWQALAGPEQQREPEGGGDADILIAGLLDVVLNKGRNLGQMVQQKQQKEEWDRNSQREADRHRWRGAEHEQRLRQRMVPRAVDPATAELKQKQLELATKRLEQSDRRLESGELKDADKRQEKIALSDPTSDVSRRAQSMALALGADESKVGEMSAADIYKWRPQIGQQLQQERSNDAWKERHGPDGLREEVQIAKEQRAQGYELDEEGRKRGYELDDEKRKAAADASQHVIPGWRSVAGIKPNAHNSGEARKIADALGESNAYAQELEELSVELGAKAKLGNLSAVLGMDGTSSAIGRARVAHQGIMAAQRKLQNMGVPQKYELEMVEKAYPELESVDGILRAADVYRNARASSNAQARRRLKVYGYEPDEGGGPPRPAGGADEPDEGSPPGPAAPSPPAGDTLELPGGAVPDAPMGASRRTEKLRPEAQAALDAYQARGRKPAGNPAVQQQTSGGSMVAMVDPDTGVSKMVPADQVEEAERRGLKRMR